MQEEARLVLVLEYAFIGDLSRLWKKIGNQANEQHVAKYMLEPVLQVHAYHAVIVDHTWRCFTYGRDPFHHVILWFS